MIDLKPEHLAIIQNILATHVPEKIIWAYGSRISGKSHGGSDLDLVVINPSDPSLLQDNLPALRAAFSDSNLPFLVDILDWANIPDTFRQEIKRNHAIVQTP